ncbi:MAG: SDR family oxidoreductase [Gemmataceae bacterium]
MSYRELAGKRVLITGASQGIGRALAVEAARRGCKVVAAARKGDLINELVAEIQSVGRTCAGVVADVTTAADRRAMLDSAIGHYGGLDILINNAGIGATGHFVDNDPQTMRNIFEVNYFGLCELVREAIPILKQGTQPCICNISSVLGRRAIPGRSMYSASKFAVAGFSEALRAELVRYGIDVTVVNPGLTKTNFSQNMLEKKAKHSLDHLRGMTSETVAVKTLDAIEKGKYEITLTAGGKFLVLLNRFAPRIIDFVAKRRVKKAYEGQES